MRNRIPGTFNKTLPHRAYIPQNAAGVLTFSKTAATKESIVVTHLAITGLFCCVGLVLWDKHQQRGLLAHLDSDHAEQSQNIPNMLCTFFAAMDCDPSNVEASLIYAKDNIASNSIFRDPLYASKYQL